MKLYFLLILWENNLARRSVYWFKELDHCPPPPSIIPCDGEECKHTVLWSPTIPLPDEISLQGGWSWYWRSRWNSPSPPCLGLAANPEICTWSTFRALWVLNGTLENQKPSRIMDESWIVGFQVSPRSFSYCPMWAVWCTSHEGGFSSLSQTRRFLRWLLNI